LLLLLAPLKQHAFLFDAKLSTDAAGEPRLDGNFYSQWAWHETWTAVPAADVSLADPLTLTHVVEEQPIEWSSYSFLG
jgi:hypothetical protein